ncbi:MAG: ribose-phosphate pyrophosphokinase [Spirochaetaceae bacterium]|nr:MAG: ribose-phosphate pyrophosphokinase [Spirochaetaceae bacterium]
MRGELLILSTRSMREYASRVAFQIETFPDYRGSGKPRDFVGKLKTLRFADGEMEVEVDTSLRGKDVFLFATASRNEFGIEVDEAKIELYHSIDALRRAQAGRITLFEPYYSASRSDRTTRRNSVGFWVHYKTLVSLGVNHIITYQLHSDKSKTAVDPAVCAIDDVPAGSLINEYITDNFIKTTDYLEQVVQKQWLFCSVDAGSEGIAKTYSSAFGTPLMIAHKRRDYEQANTVESVNILSDTPIEGKEVWIVDDMIDTAGSVYTLVKELRKRKVSRINIAAVHPVFSDPAIERLRSLYEEELLDRAVVVDTVDCPEDLRQQMPFLHVVSSARRSAEIIMRINEEKSLSPFFEEFNCRDYLNSSLKLFI